LSSPKNIYFISDVHLGLYPPEKSAERERILVSWLNTIKDDAGEIFLLGDIFDFWHEYKHVVPRGFTRFLGKLSELSDRGIQLHLFTGNHDVWIYDYLPSEIGLTLHREHILRDLNGKKFFIGHGDGLGPGDKGYKILKWAFTNRVLQFFFARIHPNAAVGFGKKWSKSSRYAKGIIADGYQGDDKEFQVRFAKQFIQNEPINYFVFGHRHVPFDVQIADQSRVINVGDWINNFTYAVWDGNELAIHSIYPENEAGIIRK
jgi:UDP-2,3-diacylglucosamine hydrolase